MNLQEALDALKMTKNLFLFDPMNGDVLGPDRLNDDNRLTLEAVEYSIKAITELAALRERYRWRKQSEELAPETYEKVIWIREEEYDCGGIFEWNGSVCCGKCVPLDCYWRPLDLPEPAK